MIFLFKVSFLAERLCYLTQDVADLRRPLRVAIALAYHPAENTRHSRQLQAIAMQPILCKSADFCVRPNLLCAIYRLFTTRLMPCIISVTLKLMSSPRRLSISLR